MLSAVIKYVREFLKEMKRDHVSAYAAQAAYFTMLSFIPFVLLLLTLLQYTALTKENLYAVAQTILPDSLDRFVIGIVDEVYNRGALAISLSAVMATWSAAKAFLSLIRGMNVIYDVEERRNYLMLRLRATLYTFLFVVAIILSLVLLVFGNSIHHMILRYIPILGVITGSIIGLKNIISLGVFTSFFVVIYRFVPNRKATLASQVPGALFTSLGWFAFSTCFSIYVDVSASFTNMYGSLTTIILVMLWLYACMYIMLIGAELNAYFEDQFYQLRQARKQARHGEKKGRE
ncbi:MAG: YihY/virulence factor BrkB family protein [Lachnospiraceae bacterium]|jgi:membrane protein|nr:YihY/virulence factor BrkB family protein [Lachnospiraceae bacterium]MCI8996051.1 YihY/virulence factor BrkB family protein [Lachnospiraceae bacterium]MCI9134821.1 YihY/virulence factor BrkB family protein [Lachnospiraceae bacterium]